MKKILLVSGIALFSSATMFAQQQTAAAPQSRAEMARAQRKQMNPEEIAKLRTARLDKVVSLQTDQKEKVYAVYLKQAQAAKERAASNKEDRSEIESILSADQNAKLKAYQQERMDNMRQRLREGKTVPMKARGAVPAK